MKKYVLFLILLAIGFGLYFWFKTTTPAHTPGQNFEISARCSDAKPIRYSDGRETYFAQCMCFVSDGGAEPVFWDLESVNHTEYETDTPAHATELCNAGCAELCEKMIGRAIQENPNIVIPQRW